MTNTNPRDLILKLTDLAEGVISKYLDVVGADPDALLISDLIAEARAYLAQPEPEGPTAWMYLGEPDYDGRDWHDHWEVTLDEKLARYASGNNDPVPLWRTPAINPAPQDS